MDSRHAGRDRQLVSITTASSSIPPEQPPQPTSHATSQKTERIPHNPDLPAASQCQKPGQARLQQGCHPCDDHEEHLAFQYHSPEIIATSPSSSPQQRRRPLRSELHREAFLARIEASSAGDNVCRAITPPLDHTTTAEPARGQPEENVKRKSDHENLLVTMVRQGDQCRVQQLGGVKGPSVTSYYRDFLQMEDEDYEMLGLVRTLEVDCQMTPRPEDEYGPTPRETFRLSTSRQPLGISKHGGLRYRTSGEAGLNCRALKRNMPRMRRRPKATPAQSRPGSGQEDSITRPGTATSAA